MICIKVGMTFMIKVGRIYECKMVEKKVGRIQEGRKNCYVERKVLMIWDMKVGEKVGDV